MSKSHKIKTNLFGKDRNGDNEKKHVKTTSTDEHYKELNVIFKNIILLMKVNKLTIESKSLDGNFPLKSRNNKEQSVHKIEQLQDIEL